MKHLKENILIWTPFCIGAIIWIIFKTNEYGMRDFLIPMLGIWILMALLFIWGLYWEKKKWR